MADLLNQLCVTGVYFVILILQASGCLLSDFPLIVHQVFQIDDLIFQFFQFDLQLNFFDRKSLEF